MPKGRKKRDYDKEIEEAAERMRKRPEHLQSARNRSAWKRFLVNIGVIPESMSSDRGSAFWEDVRQAISPPVVYYSTQELIERGIREETGKLYRDAKGHFTKEAEGNTPVSLYRNIDTGQFVSRKKK